MSAEIPRLDTISRLATLHESVVLALAELDDLQSALEQVESEIINLGDELRAKAPVL